MPLRIELLGGFATYRASQARPLPVRSNSRIFILLALNALNDLPRKSIVQTLWPEQDTSSALNRLRVALSGLRKLLGTALVDQDGYVRLNLDCVQVDYLTAVQRLEALKDEVDEIVELALLEESLGVLGKELLPRTEESWLDSHQQAWTLVAQRSLQRMSDLALKANNLPLVVQASEAAFQHDPFDDSHWQAYLKARSMLGDAVDALRAFTQTQRRLRKTHDTDFNDETLELVEDIKFGRCGLNFQTTQVVRQREAEYLSRLVSKAIDTDPEAAMAVFGIAAGGYEHTNYPDTSVPILEMLVKQSNSQSMNWQKTLFNLLVVKSGLNDSAAVLEYGPQLLEVTSDLRMRSLAMAYMAFAYLQLRKYEDGVKIINDAIEIMEKAGRGPEAFQLYTNKASLLWHQGYFEEAIRLYQLSDEGGDYIGGEAGERIRGVNACNTGLVYVMMGNLPDAKVHMERAFDILMSIGLEAPLPLLLPSMGYIRFLVDDDVVGIDNLIQGLKIAYRRKHQRGQQIGLDFAAGVLVKGGNGAVAASVLAYAKVWRESTSHSFSTAEQMLVDRILAQCSESQLSCNEFEGWTPREVLNRVIQDLRVLHRQTAPQ